MGQLLFEIIALVFGEFVGCFKILLILVGGLFHFVDAFF
jgi:hypothetical protein